MPFLIGGLVGAVVVMALLVAFTDRDSSADSRSETGTHHHAEGHAHDSSEAATGPVVDLTNQSDIRLDIKDHGYSKPNIKVAKGTRITWTNRDEVKHNAMGEHSGGDAAHEAPTAAEVRSDVFAGPLLAQGESYSFTFAEAGEYPYHCAPHPSMKGLVTVTDEQTPK